MFARPSARHRLTLREKHRGAQTALPDPSRAGNRWTSRARAEDVPTKLPTGNLRAVRLWTTNNMIIINW